MTSPFTLAVLNPNASEDMTAQMVETVRRTLGAGFAVIGYTNHGGPLAIQGPEDGAACLTGLIAEYDRAVSDRADAVIVGCFDDTGVSDLRQRGEVPVVGLGEAGCIVGSLAAPSFIVVTSLDVSIPVIAENISRSGLAGRCKAVVASGVPVLDLRARVGDVKLAIARACEAHAGSAVVLGCGGMTAIMPALDAEMHGPLIDPVEAAARLVQGMLSV